MAYSANETPTVRILVVGDSGVGKTSLVHQLAYSKPQPSTTWTVGCEVQILPFDVGGQPYFVEFWDVGGSPRYSASRSTFYQDFDGLILVHDLNNKISYQNLRAWHTEVTAASSGGAGTADPEELIGTVGGLQPTLVVGTNVDRAPSRQAGALAQDLRATSVNINTLSPSALASGSVPQRAVHEYYTAVITKKFRSYSSSGGAGRRRQAGDGVGVGVGGGGSLFS